MNRLTEAVLTSTHELCFKAKIKKEYPYKLQFYDIKVGCNRVYITRTGLHDMYDQACYTLTKNMATTII